jgi:hypothetical protein
MGWYNCEIVQNNTTLVTFDLDHTPSDAEADEQAKSDKVQGGYYDLNVYVDGELTEDSRILVK